GAAVAVSAALSVGDAALSGVLSDEGAPFSFDASTLAFPAVLPASPADFSSPALLGPPEQTISSVATTSTDRASQPARFLMHISPYGTSVYCSGLPFSRLVHKLFGLFGLVLPAVSRHFYRSGRRPGYPSQESLEHRVPIRSICVYCGSQ